MSIYLRLEEENDYRVVENLIRESFWDLYKPGCVEHLLVHNIRKSPSFVKELGFVACDENVVIGSIFYTKAKVIDSKNTEVEVLCMGPVGVLQPYQKQGIGALLINHSITKATQLNYKAVILFGNPDYYKRFGFVNAEKYNIKTSQGVNFDAFMSLELYEDSLKGVSGKFHEDKVFDIDPEELELFEKQFPYKEKHVTDTQLKI